LQSGQADFAPDYLGTYLPVQGSALKLLQTNSFPINQDLVGDRRKENESTKRKKEEDQEKRKPSKRKNKKKTYPYLHRSVPEEGLSPGKGRTGVSSG
jgi:hypothetical protein